MAKSSKLSKTMTVDEFNNGYYYAKEIKGFAKEIGIPNSAELRKDELEELIKHFLKTGKVKKFPRDTSKSGIKDIEIGLSLSLPIIHYTSNKITKEFIQNEALKIKPSLRKKSGAKYRLNRWREEQLNKGIKITYGDLVNKYIELNQTEEKFEKIPSGRYINFISDFLANETGATKQKAIKEWEELKKLNTPKDYKAWKAYKNKP